MRRIVAALVVAALALTLVGCGGGGAETTTEQTPTTAAPAAPPEVVPTDPDRSANDYDEPPVAFPSFTTTVTPTIFSEKLAAGRAMLILFFDARQEQTTDVRAEVDAVMTEYRGLIDLITLDTNGESTNPNVQGTAVYASELGVVGTPYIIIVDKGGFITWRNKGYVERGIIEREVQRATK